MNKLIYGIHAVYSILQCNPQCCKVAYIIKNFKNKRLQPIIDILKKQNIFIHDVSMKWMDTKTTGKVHQGILLEITHPKRYNETDLLKFLVNKIDPFLLVLDNITDPYNLGSCLRTANAAGVDAIIIPKNRSANINNTTVKKVASGAIEHCNIFTVTNITRILKSIHELQIWVIGTAEKSAKSLYNTKLTGSIALVMGSESEGIRRLTKKYCDELINIPIFGNISTLNVSVATGICLFEVVRQRVFDKYNNI
ncbi:MAG: 23S rRNA (guanosine(2251)-2'-O)-methyltransferase RlmB [Candidatus Dasytiphilus stammeri]